MTKLTQQHIFDSAKHIFAVSGYDGLSMRALARSANVSLSVTYHYYADKDVLLKDIFNRTNTNLGLERAKLPVMGTLSESLRQRIEFQFKHMADIVFVLKYYMHYRDSFKRNETGFVPPKTSLHIQEILEQAQERGELGTEVDVVRDAKVITHAINGFMLEIYPAKLRPQERLAVIVDLHRFIMRSLTNNREVPMP